MHISLTEKLDEYVREKVKSGLYNNASEVIREALRLKISEEETGAAKLARLREAIDLGWEQAEGGECVPFDMQDILQEFDRDLPVNA